jgi:hypothetical protein
MGSLHDKSGSHLKMNCKKKTQILVKNPDLANLSEKPRHLSEKPHFGTFK